jgi:hypothetical protein
MEIAQFANEASFISGVAGTMISMTLIVRTFHLPTSLKFPDCSKMVILLQSFILSASTHLHCSLHSPAEDVADGTARDVQSALLRFARYMAARSYSCVQP